MEALLAEGRRREKSQTLYYRALAAAAEERGDLSASERLNELHADEQHHLSRLTARLLELRGRPQDLRDVRLQDDAPAGALWEDDARRREHDEVLWYERALDEGVDEVTRALLLEILESERHHMEGLRGKWMSA